MNFQVIMYTAAILIFAVGGIFFGWWFQKKQSRDKLQSAEEMAKKMIADAERQVEQKKKEAKEDYEKHALEY